MTEHFPHPEGEFEAKLLYFRNIMASCKPPFAYLRARVQTSEGILFGTILGTFHSLSIIKACEESVKKLPFKVRVVHREIDGNIYVSGDIMYHEH